MGLGGWLMMCAFPPVIRAIKKGSVPRLRIALFPPHGFGVAKACPESKRIMASLDCRA